MSFPDRPARDEHLQAARQIQADLWGPFIRKLREAGPEAMASLVYSPARHEGGVEALERKLAGLLEGRRAA